MYAWSQAAMAECSMQEKPIIYKTEKTGLWGEAVRQRRPVITNDYAAPGPAKKGYPEGHPHIIRHMNVPVLDEGRIVLVAGVANKQSDYTEDDVSELRRSHAGALDNHQAQTGPGRTGSRVWASWQCWGGTEGTV